MSALRLLAIPVLLMLSESAAVDPEVDLKQDWARAFGEALVYSHSVTFIAETEDGKGVSKGMISCEGGWVRTRDEGFEDQEWYTTDSRGAAVFQSDNTYYHCYAADRTGTKRGEVEIRNLRAGQHVIRIVVR